MTEPTTTKMTQSEWKVSEVIINSGIGLAARIQKILNELVDDGFHIHQIDMVNNGVMIIGNANSGPRFIITAHRELDPFQENMA